MRAQSSLPSLAIALVVLVTTTVFALSVAQGQLGSADREALERETAVAISDRLVGAESSITDRENVVEDGALEHLSVDRLRETYGLGREDAVRVSLDGEAVLTAGDAGGGTTVERLVLVENRTVQTILPRFAGTRSVTLPRRSRSLSLTIAPAGNTTVDTVRSNGAVLLEDPRGLRGTYDTEVSRYETATLSFEGSGILRQGDVAVSYRPRRTRKARLRVTVERLGDENG